MDRLRGHAYVGGRDQRSCARSDFCDLHRDLRGTGDRHEPAAADAGGPHARRCVMSTAEVIAGILWLALTAYAVLAGADFGGGVWDLFASGPRAHEQRNAVAEAMGPVWEANHVWLIFLITGLFTAFPVTFGVLGLALFLPFTIAMVGIVFRGAAFAFRAHGRDAVGPRSPW